MRRASPKARTAGAIPVFIRSSSCDTTPCWICAPFLTHTALRNQIIQDGARIRETDYVPSPPAARINKKLCQEAGMASSMLKVVSFVLLVCLHFSHGTDPQPEQIHLSSTGKEKNACQTKKKNEIQESRNARIKHCSGHF